MNSFHMFNEISNDFPGCAGTVTWQELELGADVDTNTTYTDVYLVCNGTGEVTPPQECQAPRGQTYTESCPNGQTGTITYTWQGEPTCSYKKTDNCQEEVCQPTKGQSYTEECPEGQTGTITYTWNQSTCSYKETNDCIDAGCGPEPARPAETRKVCDSCGYTNFLGYVCNTDTRQWEEDWSSCVAGDVVRSGDYRVMYSNRAECCPFVDPIEEADNWDIITRESGISPKACWLGELSQRASNYNASYWGNLPNCPQLEGRRYSWCYNVAGGSSPVVEYVEQNRDCAASVGVNQACLFTETKDVGCGDYEVWQCKVSKNW